MTVVSTQVLHKKLGKAAPEERCLAKLC